MPKEGEITAKEKIFADLGVSLRQERDNAERYLKKAQSNYEMYYFAAEVNHQYIMNKERSKAKEIVVKIFVDKIRASAIEYIGKDRSSSLSQTEKDVFLSLLDEYFHLRMATSKECKKAGFPINYCIPSLDNSGCFFVTRK